MLIENYFHPKNMSLDSKLLQIYFPQLSTHQHQKLNDYQNHLSEWNKKVNLISENDIQDFTIRHFLPCLSILKVLNFTVGMNVLDLGTGGGLPGIPLAIVFDKVNFVLVDSIGKKANAVRDIINLLELKNVTVIKSRGEDLTGKFNLILTRAAVKINQSLPWLLKLLNTNNHTDTTKGIVYFKGGDLKEELMNINYPFRIISLYEFYKEEYLKEKVLVHFYRERN